MNHCASCGVSIPDRQRVCSVCYGDPEYGRDGYLRRMMEEDALRQDYERQMEREQEPKEPVEDP